MTPPHNHPTSQSIDLTPYEALYKHFHANPELSNVEINTSQTCISHLSALKVFTLHTLIGGYGLAGVFANGPGKTIMLRADMDALPILEDTGLPYASKTTAIGADGLETPVMHACGHDMHMTCLLAASEVLVRGRDAWSGTLIVLFQPAEERGSGARAMVDDGLYDRIPVPDFVLGQHVMAMRAGAVGLRSGTLMAGADSLRITLFGRGGHGSQPHRTVDPALLAAHVVVRLQGVVSREVGYNDVAVLTVGSVQVGRTENVIADEAVLGVDFRSTRESVREGLMGAIERIVKAECVASGCVREPVIERTRFLPCTVNDEGMAKRLKKVFGGFFKGRFDGDLPVTTIAEDFSILATARDVPCVFWHWGGVDEEVWDGMGREGRLGDVPMNHSKGFKLVVQPTLRTGVDTLVVAALEFFGCGEGVDV
ncbi:hypothetical protein IFR05_000995 [Cadophora sp. M221]|nr:hypothetical protein IFR05_000995 [Cadophora sp. M221]